MAGIVARGPERDNAARELRVATHLLDPIRERHDAAPDVRVPLRQRVGERISVDDVPGSREQRNGVEIAVPADVVDVEVREEDDVDLVGADAQRLEGARKQALLLGRPVVPQSRGANAGVDDDRRLVRADQVRKAGEAPRRAGEELWIVLAVRLPVLLGHPGIRLDVLAQHADRVEHRLDLDRPDYHFTRGGAGSPWASCHETTGLRRTPIRSISHSMTSPGLR